MIIKRDFYLNKLIDRRKNGRIKVITGIRRCGKSVLLFEIFRNYLINSGINDNQIVELKLDIGINARYRNPLELDKFVREKVSDRNRQYFVLIDEIQEVKSIQNPWLEDVKEKISFVDVLLGLLDMRHIDVYVTGSNSKMLSSDIITQCDHCGSFCNYLQEWYMVG